MEGTKKEVVSFHELMQPYLKNLLEYLRKVLAEENAPETVSVAYLKQFQAYAEDKDEFEGFVEHIITNFWVKKDPQPQKLMRPSEAYRVNFEAMEEQKKDSQYLIWTAYQGGKITAEQYQDFQIMTTYEMQPQNKEKFRRYLSMFCEVRHDSNAIAK